MADDVQDDGIVAGLKQDVDQHLKNEATAAPVADDGIVAGLKADVDAHLNGTSRPNAPSASKSHLAPVDLRKMTRAQKIMYWESGGDANAKAPTSSATGAGQFINSTWLPLIKAHRPDLAAGKSDDELLAMRSDPNLSAELVEAHAKDNEAKLKSAGIPVSDASIYGAHWFGHDKLAQITKADPKTPIEKLIGADAATGNGLAGKTTDDVKTLLATRMGGDYMPQDQSWGDTLSQAGSNLLPSVGHLAAGVYQSVRHPVDTYHTLKQIGVGLDSKIRGYAGEEQKPEDKAKDEAMVDALAASYKEKYGTLDGFKQYMAHDPAGVLFDLSTVLTGGGSAAARLPGIAGKAGEFVGSVGKAVNPLNPMGAVSGGVKAATMPASALDKAGNITPKVDALIKKVTKGTMSAADLIDPDVKAAFAETVAKKGASEASVREALLKSLGLKAPTSVVEGIAPPLAAKEHVAGAIGENNERLATHAGKLAGAPSPSNLGEALDNAHTASMNAASAAYDKIRNMPGSFGPTMPEMGGFGTLVKKKFDKSGIPTADLKTIAQTGHPQAAKAIGLIKTTWGSGKTLLRKDVNSSEILTMRKALNNMRATAQGSDIKAVGDVIDAFDEHIADLSRRGFFVDTNGRAVQNVGNQIQKANAAYKTHFDTFETPNKANNSIVNAVKTMKNGQGRDAVGNLMPSGDADLYIKAQAALGKELLHPTKGSDTYNRLTKALGTSAPVDEHIRSLLANPETKGASDMLNSSVGTKAFAGAPDDLARARHLHAAHAINNKKPSLDARSASILHGVMGGLAAKGVSSLAGYEALGPAGLVAGPLVEGIVEKGKEALHLKKAMAGARHTQSWPIRTIGKSARRVTNPAALAIEHYEDEAQKQEPIARARGGKVDKEALVNRLVNRWRQAKRSTNRTTEPLLHMHDDVIAKALNIAQRNI